MHIYIYIYMYIWWKITVAISKFQTFYWVFVGEKANLKRGQRGMITIVEMASIEGNSWIAKAKLEKLLLTFLRFFVKSSLLSLC